MISLFGIKGDDAGGDGALRLGTIFSCFVKASEQALRIRCRRKSPTADEKRRVGLLK